MNIGRGLRIAVGLIVEHGKGDGNEGEGCVCDKAGKPQLQGRDGQRAVRHWNVRAACFPIGCRPQTA